jgi:O-succinylbenzoic acid--CoA ligase
LKKSEFDPMDAFDLREICVQYGSLPALISASGTMDYRALASSVAGTRAQIKKSGILSGEAVGILSGNTAEMILLILALMQTGSIPVPLNTRLPRSVLPEYLSRAECRKLIVQNLAAGSADGDEPEIIPVKNLVKPESGGTPVDLEPLQMEQSGGIIFTSGSLGKAAAAVHSIGNHYYSALGSNMNIDLAPGDKWLLSLPLYHVGGLSVIFRCLLAGAAVVIADRDATPGGNIGRYETTHISLVGTQLHRLLEEQTAVTKMKRMKAVLLGGGPVGRRLISSVVGEGLPVFVSYGLTEMASQVTTTVKNDSPEHLFTAGKLLPYREMKISEEQEILVRGRTLFKGYMDNGKIDPGRSSGWFATGDLGSLDESGYLSVLGRRDNMFISGGENIQPEEIEMALMDIPGIESAVVVDIPDEEYGARPFAFITTDKDPAQEYIRSFLSERLQRYKIPVHFVLEKIKPLGLKPQRQVMRQKALEWLRDQSPAGR